MTVLKEQSAQGQWSSRFSFIMATTGAAVGMGNIWKFPYMAGDNGGGAFVAVYLVCVALIGIPAMIAEVMIGRRGCQNPVNTMSTLAKEAGASAAWQGVGWLGAGILLLVLSFYSVVAGWSLAYIFKALSGVFQGQSAQVILSIWGSFLSEPSNLLVWHTIFMIMTLTVVARGVQAGIERASRIMMPGLFFVLLFLVGYAYINGDFAQSLTFLFSFRFDQITPPVIIDAMGHAFFTLAIGAGCMLVYGSYLSKKVSIPRTVMIISVLDVMVACLAGMAIFPILFAHHLTPEAGPGLMFKVLPIAFAQMPAGNWVGAMFFVLLLFAAWTSSLSMAEPLVVLIVERWHWTRRKAAWITGSVAWTLGIASLLSFNVWSDVKLFHRWGIFQALTDVSTNILLPIGGSLFCLFVAWVMKRTSVEEEVKFHSRVSFNLWYLAVRFIAPLGILVVFLSNFA